MDIQAKRREWLKEREGLKYGMGIEGYYKQGHEWTKTKYKDAFWSAEINLVGMRKDQTVIEFDGENAKEFLEQARQKLIDNNIRFTRSTHKGKSDYLWVEFTRNLTDTEKKKFLMWAAPEGSEIDLNFASSKKIFPVMYAPHWKHSYEMEMPIEEHEGKKIDFDKLGLVPVETKVFEYETYKKPMTPEKTEELQIELGKYYEKIIEVLRYYLDLPENYYHIVSIWILGTYLHECFDTYPYLYANAMRGSAKTRLLKLLAKLSRDGEILASLTEAVLFRTTGTLCVDEFERVDSKEKGALRELLNVAYKKGIKIKRMRKSRTKEGEKQIVEEFDSFRPVAMANIWGMEEVLGDRCLSLVLEKSSNPAVILKIEDFDKNYTISEIKSFLQRERCSLCSVVMSRKHTQGWNRYISERYKDPNTTTNYTTTYTTYNTYNTLTTLQKVEIEEMYNKIHDSKIDGRNLELLFPLLIIAKLLNEETFELLLKIGVDLIRKRREEEMSESKDVALIDFVSQWKDDDFILVSVLTSSFKTFLSEEDDDDKHINSRWVGRGLKRLNLIKERRRLAKGREVMLDIEKAKEKIKMFKEVENDNKQL